MRIATEACTTARFVARPTPAAPPDAPPQVGYIASVRGVEFFAPHLDDAGDTLEIVAERVSGDDNVVLYAFTVSADGRCLLRGRASVVLDAERLTSGAQQS